MHNVRPDIEPIPCLNRYSPSRLILPSNFFSPLTFVEKKLGKASANPANGASALEDHASLHSITQRKPGPGSFLGHNLA
jgi:hypothetical protein